VFENTSGIKSSSLILNPIATLISALAPYDRYPPLISKEKQRFELKSFSKRLGLDRKYQTRRLISGKYYKLVYIGRNW